jgi:D-sedoheptulose 7-phosphate isomerase
MSIEAAFLEHQQVFEASFSTLIAPLRRGVELVASCLAKGGKVLICGNGGSAANAEHFAAELLGRMECDRHPLPAMALSANTSAVTSIANDFGYEQVFCRQIKGVATREDILIALSASGNSPNIVAAVREAVAIGCPTIGLTGEGGGKIGPLVNVLLAVPSARTTRVQEIHALCLHALAEAVEEQIENLFRPKIV